MSYDPPSDSRLSRTGTIYHHMPGSLLALIRGDTLYYTDTAGAFTWAEEGDLAFIVAEFTNDDFAQCCLVLVSGVLWNMYLSGVDPKQRRWYSGET